MVGIVEEDKGRNSSFTAVRTMVLAFAPGRIAAHSATHSTSASRRSLRMMEVTSVLLKISV